MNPRRMPWTILPSLLLGLAAGALSGRPAAAAIRFEPASYLVGVSADDVTAIEAIDLDNDGDLDLVTGSRSGADVELVAWENPGGTLVPGWLPHDIGTVPGGVRGLAVADLDQDGAPDLVTGSFTGEIEAWRNDGTPFDGTWASVIAGSGAGSQRVTVADLDLDGFPDIASSSRGADDAGLVAIWRNDGTPFDNAWAGLDLYPVLGLGEILSADVDRDGDPDLVLSHDFTCVSAIGNGGSPFDGASSWEAIGPVGCPTGSPVIGVGLSDFDGDGLLDVVITTQNPEGESQFVWQGTTDPFVTGWTRSEFGSGSPGTVIPADLDLDGDPDLSTGSPDYSTEAFEVAGWENDGLPFAAPWVRRDLGAPDHAVLDLAAGDLDGDGDVDLISAGGSVPADREIRIWENLAIILGPPVIEVTPASLDFGLALIGEPVTRTVVVRNRGGDPLVVTGISSDNPVFAPAETDLTVLGRSEQELTVTFTPTGVASFNGTLTLPSNDPGQPAVTVALHGEGRQFPTIEVMPESLSTVLVSGQTATELITVSNTGAGDLVVNIDVNYFTTAGPIGMAIGSAPRGAPLPSRIALGEPAPTGEAYHREIEPLRPPIEAAAPAPTPPAGQLKLLILHTNSNVTEIRNLLAAYPEFSQVDTLNMYGATPDIALLRSYNAIIVAVSFAIPNPVTWGDALADYVDGGGGLIVTLASMIQGFAIQGRILTGGYLPFNLGSGPLPGSAALGNYNLSHPIMAGVGPTQGSVLGALTLTGGTDLVASWNTGQPFVATKGSRVVGVNIYIAEPGYWFGSVPLILHNAVLWSGGGFRDWIRVDPSSFIVPGGETVPVAVTLNAAGAPGGGHDAQLRLTSNDPEHRDVYVPVHMQVIPAPDIELQGLPVLVESIQNYAADAARTDHTLPAPVPPAGSGFIDLVADGDFGFPPEFATLTAEGLSIGTVGNTGTDCTPASGTFPLNPAQLSLLVADGVVHATVQNSFEVNVFCAVNRHTVRLRYNGPAGNLDFGPVFIGGSRSLSISVRNNGTDALVVSGISSDRPEFTADPTVFTVNPGVSATLAFTFAPVAPGALTAHFTLQSNDPDEPAVTVTVHGEGTVPPDIGVSPESFSETMPTGQTLTRVLTVANTGGSPLSFSARIMGSASGQIVVRRPGRTASGDFPSVESAPPAAAPPGSSSAVSAEPPSLGGAEGCNAPRIEPAPAAHQSYGPLDPRILVYSDDPFLSPGSHYVDLALRALDLSYTAYYNDPNGFGAALIGGTWDLVVVDHNNFFAVGQWWNEVAAYKASGGRLLISTFDMDGSNSEQTALWNQLGATPVGDRTINGPVYFWDAANPIFHNPESVPPFTTMVDQLLDNGDRMHTTPSSLAKAGFETTVTEGAGGILISADNQAILNSFLVMENRSDLDQDGKPDGAELLTNEIRFLLGELWLSVAPVAGVVPAGGAVELAVTFDTTQILGGSYDASIHLSTNDPDEAEVEIPVHLLAVGIPDIEMTGEDVIVESVKDYFSDAARTVHSLPIGRPPAGAAHIDLLADGDYGDTSEFATATAEGHLLGSTGSTGTDCTRASGSFLVGEELLQSLIEDGRVEVEVQNSTNVNFFCSPNRHTVRLRYTTAGKNLDFGPLSLGESRELAMVARNLGTDALTVTGLSISPGEFTADTSTFTLPPGGSRLLRVQFSPTTPADFSGALVIKSDDPDEPEVAVPLHGSGLVPTDIRVSPGSFTESLLSGQAVTHPLLLENLGGNTLHWEVSLLGQAGGSLEDLLAALDENYELITSKIPGRFDFLEGETGDHIDDGGEDMYDLGNYLGTELGFGIPYSNGVVTSSLLLGPTGRYFTRKYPGLFVFAAELDGVSRFSISGNVGADGGGLADGTVLHVDDFGVSYLGLVKRIYDAGDPSVNHLIIVQEQPGIDHVFSLNTDDDSHVVSGLAGTRRLVYLLYAGSGGARIDDGATEEILRAFLGLSPVAWLNASPRAGSLAPGGWIKIPVRIDSTDVVGGNYDATIQVRSNDADQPEIAVPVHLQVIGKPDIDVPPSAMEFGTLFAGGSRSLSLTVRNRGSEVLEVSRAGVDGAEFRVDPDVFSVPPRQSRILQVSFVPTVPGVFTRTLTFESNDPDEPAVAIELHGTALAAPDIELTPGAFSEDLLSGDAVERTLTIANVGGNPLDFTLATSVAGGSLQTVLEDDIEQVVPGWTTQAYLPDDLWHRSHRNYHSPTTAWWCGIESQGNYQTTSPISNAAITPEIDLRNFLGPITLEFWENYQTEPGWDFCMVDVSTNGGLSWSQLRGGRGVAPAGNSFGWIRTTLDLSAYAGTTIKIRFFFDTGDSILNAYPGWFFDDVTVRGTLKWLRFAPETGSVLPGAAASIAVTIDATGLLGGDYDAPLIVSSNDPDESVVPVPIHLHVTGAPDIRVTPASLDFGSVVAGESRTLDLTVTNGGTDVLAVSSVTADHPGYSANPASFSLPVGATRKVAVTFAPLTPGPGDASLTLESNDPTEPTTVIPLFGQALAPPDIAVSPDSLSLTLETGHTGTATLRLDNTGANPLTWQIQTAGAAGSPPGPAWLSVAMDAGGIPAGTGVDVAVIFNAIGRSPGIYPASLRILSNDPDEALIIVPVQLEVPAPLEPDIGVGSTLLDFGTVTPGAPGSQPLTVRNDGTARLEVTGIGTDNGDFTVDPTPFGLDPGGSRVLTVSFTPRIVGQSTGTLTLTSNDPNEGQLPVSLRAAVNGQACLQGYVTENWNGQLTRVDLGTGAPTLVTAALDQPTGVATAGAGAPILVTEYALGQLVSVNPVTGAVTVVASGLAGPTGVALDASGTSAFVAELEGGQLSRVDLGTGTVTPVAGGLDGPIAVTLNPAGSTAYVVETFSGNLLAVNVASGTVSPVASGLQGPYGMALNPAGDTAYVAEWDIGRLSAVSLATGAITPLVSGLSGPFGVALSPAGNIAYVAESSSGRLTSVDLSTGNTLIVNGGLIGPLGAAVFPQPGCTP